jgi:hypothetical protein
VSRCAKLRTSSFRSWTLAELTEAESNSMRELLESSQTLRKPQEMTNVCQCWTPRVLAISHRAARGVSKPGPPPLDSQVGVTVLAEMSIHMKRIALLGAVLGATILALAGSALAAPGTGATPCPNATLGHSSFPDGTVIPGTLTVAAGVDCRLGWVEVTGPTNVAGNLLTFGPVHFHSGVTVTPGGSFVASNYGVTIDGNLSITDPAANSNNGFFGNQPINGVPTYSTVNGNVTYTVSPAAAAAYPQYQWPALYTGYRTVVTKNVNYSVGALPNRPWINYAWEIAGTTNVS